MRVRSFYGAVTFVVGAAVLVGGCAAETGTGAGDDDELGDPAVSTNASELVDGTLDGCASQCTPGNCVKFARCRTNNDGVRGSLPFNLTTWSEKVGVINASSGHAGCVAMIPTSSVYGHAAYVEAAWMADGAKHYRLSEASWSYDYRCDNRSGTKGGLNIRGFWCP
jgi:hypothetical protein